MRYLCLSLLLYASALYADDLQTLLSQEKQQIQAYKQQKLEYAYEKQKYDWLNPLNIVLGYTHELSALNSETSDLKSASLNLSQDIFRSGGIYYTMHHAQSQKNYDQIVLSQENETLYQELFTTLLRIKKGKIQERQSRLRLKNYEIEIYLRRKQYEAGALDITLLNTTMMERNKELKNLSLLKGALANERYALGRLTDKKEEEISLPHFVLADRELFLQVNYGIEKKLRRALLLNDSYKLTRTNYLLKVTLTGGYGISEYQSKTPAWEYQGDFYSLGLRLSIPLDYNADSALQEAQAAYLKSRLEADDERRAQEAFYKQLKSSIESFQEYIELTQKNILLYDELIDVTRKAVVRGYKSSYDLSTLKNTKSIDALEIEINQLNIELELVKVHFLMQKGRDGK